MRPALIAAGLLAPLCGTGPAFAQTGDCSGFKWSVNREQAAFQKADLPVVASGTPLPSAATAAVLNLAKQDTVAFPVAPRKPKHETPYAGIFPLPSNLAPGTYQVTVSEDAWIDVAQNGKLLRQVGFTGSHTCATVHKSVRFDLSAGPATLEISDAGQEAIKVEVLPKE